MEVQLTPDQSARLTRLAQTQGRAAETLVQEAIDKLLDYDEWFLREVDHGIAEADRGDFVEHDDVRKMIEDRYPA
jgi:predicted transcriptional regulator